MSLLNSLFDVVRGWTPGVNGSSFEEDFKPDPAVTPPITEGDIIEQNASGLAVRSTSDDLAGAASVAALGTLLSEAKQQWLVVSGTSPDEYDGLIPGDTGSGFGQIPWKLVGILGAFQFKTENFAAGAYAPGDAVTVVAGQIARIPADNPGLAQYGEVREYDATAGTLVVTVK